MVPRIAQRGASFKGAGLYYLHDKDADTSERVAWTHTENLPTRDPEKALRFMAYMAMNADELKRQAGGKTSGRKASKPVFGFSLSWHPEQQPERDHMINAGRSALAALGFQEHQTVMVSHQDEAYRHLHVIVNAIHPQTGRAHTPTYSKLTLSQWAEAYEREHGKIYCEERVANNERRRKEEFVKHKDKEIEQKALITKLYREARDAQAFKRAVEKAGYQLAQGKKLLLIGPDGKTHSLARQIEGVREKDVRDRLRDLQFQQINEAREQQEKARRAEEQRKRTEEEERARREEQRKRGQGQLTEPLNTAARRPDLPAQKQGKNGKQTTLAERQADKPERYFGPPLPSTVVRLENRQRDEITKFHEVQQQIRDRTSWQVKREYGEKDRWLEKEIAAQEQELAEMSKAQRLRLAAQGTLKEKEERLAGLRLELADIENRRLTLRGRDEHEAREHAKEWQVLQARHEQERLQLGENPKFMLRHATGGEFNTRSVAPSRVSQSEKPLVELPATLQDKIQERAAQERHALVEPVNDNREAKPKTSLRAAREPEVQEPKETAINDNRRPEAQAFPQATQDQPERPAKPPAEIAPDFRQAHPDEALQAPSPVPEREPTALPETAPQKDARTVEEAELHALLEQWNGHSEAEVERAQETQEQGETSQTESTQAAEDAQLYALLDQWQGLPAPQPEQTTSTETETNLSGSTPTPEDAELHALLDQWNDGQEQGMERDISLDME